MKRSMLIPLAILGIAGVLAYAAWKRNSQAAAGEGAATPGEDFGGAFDSLFGGPNPPTPSPAPAPAPATPTDNGTA